MNSFDIYNELKNQLALEHSNAYIRRNLLQLLIDDIGQYQTLDLFLEHLASNEITVDDSRYASYSNLMGKIYSSLEKNVERLRNKDKLLLKPNTNLLTVDEKLTVLLQLAKDGNQLAANAFRYYDIPFIDTDSNLISLDRLIKYLEELINTDQTNLNLNAFKKEFTSKYDYIVSQGK